MDYLLKTKFIFIVLAIFWFSTISAQQSLIEGYAKKSGTGEPVENANIRIKKTHFSTKTDGLGAFKFLIDKSEQYTVFEVFSMKIDSVQEGTNGEIIVWLSDLTPENMIDMSIDELLDLWVVTPSKTEEKLNKTSAIITVLTAKEINKYANRMLTDVLDRAVSTYIYGSYYLPNNMVALRGEVTSHYTNHVLLMLNGRPLRSSKQGYFLPVIRSLPIASIEKIEILRGPGSALYGSGAYAGIVNIITKKGHLQETTASINYGSFGTGISQFTTGLQKQDFNFSLAGSYFNSDGWDYKVRGATIDSLYPGTNTPALENSKGITMMASYKKLSLNAYWGSNYQMIGQHSQKWWYANEWYLGTMKAMVDLGYTVDLGDKFHSDINFTYNYLKYWQPYDVHANDIREWGIFNDYSAEIANHYKFSKKLSATFGFFGTNQTGHIRNTETLSDGTPYNVWLQPKNPDPFYVVPKYNEIWWSIYANVNYSPFNFLKITTGAHANKVSNLEMDVVPRLGIVVNPIEKVALKLLYGQAFRSADYFELYSQVNGIYGNKYLKPEKITTYEAQLSFNNGLSNFALTYFNSSQKNVIGRSLAIDSLLIVNGISQPMFLNSKELASYGFELEGNIKIFDNLSIMFSSLYQENNNSDGQMDVYGLPNLFVKGGFHYSFQEKIDLGVFNMWVSKGNEFDVPYPDANPNANAFNYLTAKLSFNINRLVKLSAHPGITLYVEGFNLLDAPIYYPEYGDKIVNTIPGRAGISIYGGLKIKF